MKNSSFPLKQTNKQTHKPKQSTNQKNNPNWIKPNKIKPKANQTKTNKQTDKTTKHYMYNYVFQDFIIAGDIHE